MKKRLFVGFLALAMVISLAACGAAPSSAPAAGSTGGGASITGDPVKLTFSHWGAENDDEAYGARLAKYTEMHPNVTFERQNFTDYDQKLATVIAGGDIPDIMVVNEAIHSYSSVGAMLPLNDYIAAAGIDLAARVGQSAVDIYTADGNIYGLPDRGGCMVVYYNKDMFDAAGLDYPTRDWTWDDLLAASKAMTGGTGDDETWGFSTEYWWPYWMNWVVQGGGQVLDDAGNIVINSQENVDALTFMQELSTVHDVLPTRTEMAGIGSGASASTLFAQGRIGIYCTGLWNIRGLTDVDFAWDMAEMFKGAATGTTPFGSALTVSSKCKNPEVAFDVINWMTDVEGQEIICEYLEDAPANLAVLNSPAFLNAGWTDADVDMEVFFRSADMIYAPPINQYWNAWNTIWSDEFSGVFDGDTDPATALATVEKRMQEAMQ